MNLKFFISLLFTLSYTILFSQSNEPFFLSCPTLTPDGKTILFSYESDLWRVAATGGTAYRLTAMDGYETNPRVSPNGKWIAFSSSQDSNANVYVMPINGGEIKQLTFNDANDIVDSWSWDSEYIFFSSNQFNKVSVYKVSVNGGTPVRLFSNFFNTPHCLIEHPSGKAYIFTESSESLETNAMRKRYKGAHNPNLLQYDISKQKLELLTTYIGKDMWPTIDKKGNLFFVSDEANGEYNLYTLQKNVRQQLTSFTTSIRQPQVNADGTNIVFEKDYQIYIYNIDEKKSNKVPIQVFQNNILQINQTYTTLNKISYFDVSPDNQKIAFVSRGKLFISDINGKFIKFIPTLLGERVNEVKWLGDSKRLLFSQTIKGWTNLFITSADGSTTLQQITFDNQNNRKITLNNDYSAAVYISGRNQLKYLDLKTMTNQILVEDEFWGLMNSYPRFAPNNEYIVYTAKDNFEDDIFVYNLKTKKITSITGTGLSESQPYWSPDGKYLYFIADRENPAYPRGNHTHIYKLPLQKYDNDYRLDEINALFVKEPIHNKRKNDSTTITIQIDTINLINRWKLVFNDYYNEQLLPYVFSKQDNTILFFFSGNNENYNLIKLTTEPFSDMDTTVLLKSIKHPNNSLICYSKTNYYMLIDNTIYQLTEDGKKLKKIVINYPFTVSPDDEFNQMFYESWALLQENFYDENFHGVKWDSIKIKYQKYLPYLRNRDNLRVLINDMMGELNSSHLRFSSFGNDEKLKYNTVTMHTGIIFYDNAPYKVNYILKNSPADNINNPIQQGDMLIAVNNTPINETINREYYFTSTHFKNELLLTFKRTINKETKTYNVIIQPINTTQLKELLYDEWIENNQRTVDNKSNNNIAYVYMKNMGTECLQQFIIEMTSEWHNRNALILDLRYNTGGNVHNDILRFLIQQPYIQWQYRSGELTTQPNFTPAAKPIVLLINEHTLSDAEITAAGFKELELGKIIGTETYRWIIFTAPYTLLDGSTMRIPAWGCFTLNGENLEQTGVAPNIYIETNFKDKLENKDPQLDKAIEEIMNKLKYTSE